ncbi:MAG: hypothetical protein GY771_01970 [bacterium]|nr:hypothetical protein [bacterium]
MGNVYKIDIGAYFRVIWRFKYFIAFLFIAGGLIGYLGSRFVTPVYTSTVEFVFPEESLGAAGLLGTDFLKAVGMGGEDITGTEIEIMQSESVFGEVIDKLQLNIDRRDIPRNANGHEVIGRIETNEAIRYGTYKIKFTDDKGNFVVKKKGGAYVGSGVNGCEFKGGGISFVLEATDLPKKGTAFDFSIEDPEITLAEMSEKNLNFSITAPRIIEIKTEHYDPVVTKRMAEEIITLYVLKTQFYNISVSKEASLLLKRRINEVEIELKKNQEKMANYQIENKILYSGGETEAMVADIGIIKSTMVEAELKRDQLRLILSKMDRGEEVDTTLIDALVISGIMGSESGLTELQARITAEKALLDSLRAKYTDDHPSVIASKETINEMENSLMVQTYEVLNRALINYSDNAMSAEAKFNSYTEELPVKQMELAVLEKNLTTNTAILQALYTEYEAVKVSSIKEEGKKRKIRVIKEPHIPAEPVIPDKKRNAIISAVILGFFGVVWAFINHFFDFQPLYDRIPFYNRLSDFISSVKSRFARN